MLDQFLLAEVMNEQLLANALHHSLWRDSISLPSLSSCTTPPLGDRPFRPPLGRETGDIKPLHLDCCRVHASRSVSIMLDLETLPELMSLHLYSSRGFTAVVNLLRLPMTHLRCTILGVPTSS